MGHLKLGKKFGPIILANNLKKKAFFLKNFNKLKKGKGVDFI